MDFVELVFGLAISLIIGAIAFFFGQLMKNREWEGKISDIRSDAIKKSRAVLGGQFSEQLAPYLPDFGFSPTELRFIGKPIDFIAFVGMDEKEINEVIFVEVKSGKSGLTKHERILRDTIQQKRVRWVEYRIPEQLTSEKTM